MNLKSAKGKMARRLVLYCVIVLTVAAVWAMWLESYAVMQGTDAELSEVLVFIGGAFGGELLLLLIKRIFAKPSDKEEVE